MASSIPARCLLGNCWPEPVAEGGTPGIPLPPGGWQAPLGPLDPAGGGQQLPPASPGRLESRFAHQRTPSPALAGLWQQAGGRE